jgi:hypothetical protein
MLASPAGFFRVCQSQKGWEVVVDGRTLKTVARARQADKLVKDCIENRLKTWIDEQNRPSNERV